MMRTKKQPLLKTAERTALLRRVRQMWAWFNQGSREKCFTLVDPKLRDAAKVHLRHYTDSLRTFQAAYGSIKLWHLRINLHLDASANQHDQRPFAYVYLVWQVDANAFHMCRERWVRHGGRWYTRVVGLVANPKA